MRQPTNSKLTVILLGYAASLIFLLLFIGISGCATLPRSPQAEMLEQIATELPLEPDDLPIGTPITLTSSARQPENTPGILPTVVVEKQGSTQSLPTSGPTPTPADAALTAFPPAVLLVLENEVMQATTAGGLEQVDALPEAGRVVNAFQIGDSLLVLREHTLQRSTLSDESSELLVRFELPVLSGEFISSTDRSRVAYSAVVDDPVAEFGFRTQIAVYDTTTNSIKQVLSLPQNLRILGFAPDGSSLYILPVGQDPDFASVLQVAIDTGELSKELSIEGSWYASLSPDNRILATTALQCLQCDQPEGVIYLYDLPSLPLTPPRLITLPNGPSHITGLAWSPDGLSLYFSLVSGNPWDEPLVPYGVWRLEIPSGAVTQVAALEDARLHLRAASPDGGWLLLDHETEPEARLVDLVTGQTQAINKPAEAVLAGWR